MVCICEINFWFKNFFMYLVLFSLVIFLFIYMLYICNDEVLGYKIYLIDENGRFYMYIWNEIEEGIREK